MGKQAGPSPEELEFIFGCFQEGLNDREVLEEIQGTAFPRRSPRFLRDRRREFDAAKKVLTERGEVTASKSNWIVDCKLKTGEYPLIEDWLAPLVTGYSAGARVSQMMKLGIPSSQFWNGLLPSQQRKVQELVKWLGQDPEDYLATMRRMIPGRATGIHVTPKRKTS